MKTILYNPIFINPQAYYVFPRLTRYLQPDNESTAEPANYIGTIEVKVIAYGDTTLKRTYTNTDSIYLSEFKNTWIRISLFTKVGSCVLGEWKIGNMESDLPYIDPEVLASLKAVVIVGNKTNNDSDRAIVKNLVDASNPFVISNASYNLNSGYGKYNITFQHFPYRENIISINDNKVVFDKGGQLLLPYPSMDRDIPSFKVKVSGLSGTYHFRYYYRDSNGAQDSINMAKDGIYELPICYNVQSSSDGTNCGFANNGSDIVTIEQVPEFQGAFVTDGVNDTIISTKTVAEMGITDEVTVVSMIHQITLNTKYNIATTNYIENSDTKEHVRTDAYVAGKTGIYGYTASLINSTRSTIGYILGDIRDYQAVGTTNKQTILDSKFSVEGRVGGFGEVSSVAWYWTVIANKVLTADQINQVIAYYDLDRTLSPDIYCDVAKQGITNSNHTDSMSEFLIERQLKKHKLGTLYPDMVEFRPIIKHDDRITAIRYYHIKGSSWINLKPGDYIPVGSKISITTNLKSPYTIANVMSSSLTDIKVVPSAGGGNAYDILGYVTDKSPQKITMDIQVDSSLVQWNPVVESNVPYKSVKYYKLVDTSWKAINVGDYVLVGQRILTQITTVGIEDEVVAAVSEQLDIYGINKKPNGEYNILGITSSTTPQNINITIDEYIRYEDIVQPYPILLRFNDENGNEVSWGGKFRVGSTITRIGSIADPENNLLNGLYSVSGLSLNGKAVTSNTSIVEKQMVFKTTATYLLDNNEPKVILSPRLLRIPNSSYKLLGYIPDISGHGNHGVIHNSAYAEGSGVNEDGSYQFDGVDDFITIPTTVGGKQVLMKVNWQKSPALLYDQRASGSFAVLTTLEDDAVNPRIAYQARNQNGKTYIDGIENNNIETYTLKDITHNITIANSSLGGIIVPVIGCNTGKSSNFAKMSLYDFMLFDNISTDDKIKELNEYVGIEGNTEWRKTK